MAAAIESGPFLSKICRGQVDRDLFGWQGKSEIFDRRPHPVSAFPYLGRKVTYEDQPRKSIADVRLHGHILSLHAAKVYAVDFTEQKDSFPNMFKMFLLC